MWLVRLRHQMLIAMGLPACWIQQAPDPSPPPPPDQRPPHVTHRGDDPWAGTTTTVATGSRGPIAQAGGPGCTPESVCGRSDTRAGNTCGPFGDSLESFGPSHLSVTRINFGANPTELGTFPLDVAATQNYQHTVGIIGPTLPRYCCYAQCTPSRPARVAPLQPGPNQRVATTCVATPALATTGTQLYTGGPHPDNPDCTAQFNNRPYTHGTNSQCCYGQLATIPPPDPFDDGRRKHYRGRAARVEGTPRVAAVDRGTTWTAKREPAVAHLSADERTRLRDAWANTAQMEHASIAAFSALSLRLLALGAPAELVERTHAAALDEIRHAQLAFALASAYAGESLAPSAFADAGRLATSGTLAELALETFLDGCINETAAALEASIAAEHAGDPVVTGVLQQIATDETRHAELAWAIVAWCVRTDPTLVPLLRETCAGMSSVPASAADGPSDLACHGVLSDAELARVRADTMRGVVVPSLTALIDGVATHDLA